MILQVVLLTTGARRQRPVTNQEREARVLRGVSGHAPVGTDLQVRQRFERTFNGGELV